MADKKKSTKRKPKRSQKKQVKAKPKGIRGFYRETAGELRKVSWPTRREARSLTVVVVIVMAAMAVFLGGLDYLFFQFFSLIWNL